MRIISQLSGPAVSVDDLAAQLHIDTTDISAQLSALIAAATAVVETATNRSMQSKTIEIDLPDGDWSEYWLPIAPVRQIIDAPEFVLKRGFSEPRLQRVAGSAVERIQIEVGYEFEHEVPAQMREAVLLLAMEWYKASISVEGQFVAPEFSFGVMRLVNQVRYRRPCVVRP